MSDVRIITANSAAALAAKLCRVQVVSAYPITPQTPVTEELAELVESGELKAEYLTVESEHSAMASVVAAQGYLPHPARMACSTCMKCFTGRPEAELP